ncbi:MAG TPA: glycerol-3-phosphate dehydrogenase/oxidase [Acidimicrobiales bacterium]|nr:glycerol-3-phosphate dehydrogenase/oxidase [Acidimicrobiales bacterium]
MASFDRDTSLSRLGSERFDVLVVGGGITGTGVALDAAARGLTTALVEKDDFASGTSSKSSKLVHGGLRYLQQKEYLLVRENLAERQRLLRNAPHLVTPLPFLVPLFGKDGVVNQAVAKAYNTALWMYDLAGGLRIGRRHRRIDRDEAQRLMPTLRADRLVAGFIYYDARADDARLTLALARTAALDHGAVAANYAPVASLLHDGSGRVAGARLGPSAPATGHDSHGVEIRAGVVVNATGVWADDVRAMDESSGSATLRPAKGVHVTLPWDKLRCEVAAVIPVPGDRRSVFVVPWGNRVYVGTTDTDYDGPLDDPQCSAEDIAYLLGAVNASVTEPVSESDVLGTWAGLRPLVRQAATERTADLSRRHTVFTSDDGLVTITGGKLTTYRTMAADAVDAALSVLGRGRGRRRRSPTARMTIRGGDGLGSLSGEDGARRLGLDPAVHDHLLSRFGSEAAAVADLMAADPSLRRPLVEGLPYLAAEAVWAVRQEMARTVEDVLARRTRALLLDREATAAAAPGVAGLIGDELGWDEATRSAQVEAFLAAVRREQAATRA